MSIISREKDGEYVITTYASGHVVREIDQTGKTLPAVIKPTDPLLEIKTKLDQVIADIAIIKTQTKPKV